MATRFDYKFVSPAELGLEPKPDSFTIKPKEIWERINPNTAGSSPSSTESLEKIFDKLGEEGWIYCGQMLLGDLELPEQYYVFIRELDNED